MSVDTVKVSLCTCNCLPFINFFFLSFMWMKGQSNFKSSNVSFFILVQHQIIFMVSGIMRTFSCFHITIWYFVYAVKGDNHNRNLTE